MSSHERTHEELSAADPLSEVMELQMGPSHPASHGTIKFNLTLDGETILRCDTEIGYLHRGFEKMCEQGTWTQAIPYTDRLNYASPLINNYIFCEAAERLLGVTAPERCSYIRVILSEVSRIADHLTCLGMGATEMGAISAGFYMNEVRELLYNLTCRTTGARVTVSHGRLGGLTRDLPEGFAEELGAALDKLDEVMGQPSSTSTSTLLRCGAVAVLHIEPQARDQGRHVKGTYHGRGFSACAPLCAPPSCPECARSRAQKCAHR